MKTLNKILALAIVAMLALSMVSALADSGVTLNNAKTMEIPITQTMYFKNAEGSQVYEPNLLYTYTIAPGAADATVVDHNNNSASVKAGDMRGFGATDATTPVNFTINFSSDHKLVTADDAGKAAVTKKVTVTFNGEKLKTGDDIITPGVYRYIITNTTTPQQKAAQGVTEIGNVDNDLVLDITVTNDGTVAGSVIHESTDPDNDNPNVDNHGDPNGDNKNDEKDDEEGKQTGFGDPDPDGNDPTYGNEDPKDDKANDPTKPDTNVDPATQQTAFTTTSVEPTNCDMYVTYNVTITKAVTGTMGDKSNFFPFQTDISNSIAGAAFTYSVTDNDSGNVVAAKAQLIMTAGTKTLGSASATATDGFAIKDGGKINLIGVPSMTTANVSVVANEYNNTGDQYKTTALDFGIGSSDGTTITPFTLTGKTATNGTTAASFKDNDANTTFTVTNNLDATSPTGLVLRFAPYIAMLAAGLLIVLVSRKRRSNED